MATGAAYQAFRRTYSDPAAVQGEQEFESRAARYAMLWQYYEGQNFESLTQWGPYKARHGLYRHIRPIYNPTRRLVNFYAGIVYPGVLSTEPETLPKGTPLAIPLREDTDPALVAALGQLWQWSNWQIKKGELVRFGAALGDVMIEIVDDPGAGMVYPILRRPGLVADLTLDHRSNVKAYTIEHEYSDGSDSFVYTKTVDGDAIRTYRDGQPYSFDDTPPERDNPYGFAPACWINHVSVGSDHGDPAIHQIGKMDELNNLAAMALDQAGKILQAPILVEKGDGLSTFSTAQTKRGSTSDFTTPTADREQLPFLTGPEGVDVKAIKMDPGETLEHMDRILQEIEADHPELTMYSQLREMSQVTGPASENLIGDTRGLVQAARDNYDQGTIKAFQMAIAIAGWRAGAGDWGPLSPAQEAFAPFDLGSYAAGDLDFTILPRDILAQSERAELEKESIRIANERAELQLEREQAAGAQAANLPEQISARLRAQNPAPTVTSPAPAA